MIDLFEINVSLPQDSVFCMQIMEKLVRSTLVRLINSIVVIMFDLLLHIHET